MQVDALRASTINTYLDCPWKYFLQYVIGLDAGNNKKAALGTIVHHVLELLAKAKKNGYTEYGESKRTDVKYLCRICWNRYVAQYDEFDFDKTDMTFVYENVMKVVDSEYDPLRLKVIKTEHQFELTVDLPGFDTEEGQKMKMRGTIDLIVEADEDTLEVIDYKTGRRADWQTGEEKTYEKLQQDIQLRYYNLAVKALYPQYKNVILTIIYTQDGGPFSLTFTDYEVEETVDKIRRIFKEIKADSQPQRLLTNKDRRNEIWKCNYVCRFGYLLHEFMADDGDIIEESFRYIQKPRPGKDYPDSIERDGKVYVRITDSNSRYRVCDKYYNILRQYGIDRAGKTLSNFVEGGEASRRNDYGGSKITKLTLDRKVIN